MNTQDQIPLEQYWSVVRRWWGLIVASVLVAALSSYLSVSRAPRIYQASTTVMVGQSIYKENPTGNDFFISQQLAQTYINMVQRRPILQGAAAALELPYAPAPGDVSARLVAGTQLVEISVRDTTPERARDLADEIARQLILQTPTDSQADRERHAFVEQQLADLEENIQATQDEIRGEQARLDAANSARAIQQYQGNIAALQAKLSSYQSSYASLLGTVQGGTNYITVVEPAGTPSRPVSPRVMETVALAAAIGLILALGGAFLTEFLDDAIKSVDDATRAAGLPSLGAIPRIRGEEDADRISALHHPRSGVAEAFRTLRTNIHFSSVDRPLRTLMITSADPIEGKSLVLANLAVVMAQEGRSVLVVDADLRRPTQHKLFQLDNERGLSDAILDQDPDLADYGLQLAPERLVEPFVGEDGNGAEHAAVAGMGDLRILTSGPIPPNPADLLGSERMAALIERLQQQADVVLFDCPPVLAVADAIVLAGRVDGVLLLADAGHSRRARVARAAEGLRQVGAPVLGVVVNRVASHHGSYYYYHYYSESEEGRGAERGVPRRGVGRRRSRRRPALRLSWPNFFSGRRQAGNHDGKAPRPSLPPAAWMVPAHEPPADADRHAGPVPPIQVPAGDWDDRTDDEMTDAKTTQPMQLPRGARYRPAQDEEAGVKRTRPMRPPPERSRPRDSSQVEE